MSEVDLKNISNEILFTELRRRFLCGSRPSGSASFLGPKGIGKTIQALQLADMNCWCYISVENILKEQIDKNTDIGRKIKELQESGKEIGSNIIVDSVFKKIKEPICSRGAVLDGFPNTLDQAKRIDEKLAQEKIQIDRVILFKCPEDILITRITSNSFNKETTDESSAYKNNINNDNQRAQQLSEEIKNYYKSINPVISHYSAQKRITAIDASRNPEILWNELYNIFHKKLIDNSII